MKEKKLLKIRSLPKVLRAQAAGYEINYVTLKLTIPGNGKKKAIPGDNTFRELNSPGNGGPTVDVGSSVCNKGPGGFTALHLLRAHVTGF
jgi:hypothetical protein